MADAPWANAASQFAGWVPNVLGHLSFSLIGKGTTPNAYCVCAELGHTQELLAFQTRQSDDSALHRLLARWIEPRSVHDWLLLAHTEDASYPSSKNSPACEKASDTYRDARGMMRGTIHILGGRRWKRSGFFGQFKFRWHRWWYRFAVKGTIRRLSRNDIIAETSGVAGASLIDRAKAKGLEFGTVEVCLFRTGEARIWFDNDEAIKNSDARAAVPKIAYFFLKDITHLHTHHHQSQDGMIPFCEVNPADPDSEKGWQRRTIWALSRSIEELVRKGRRTDLRAAIGMIPYAESFHSLYGGLFRKSGELHKFDEIKDHEFDHYSFEGLRKMVATMLETRTSLLTTRTAIATAAIPITLSSVIAVNAVGGGTKGGANWPDWLSGPAYEQPALLIPIILVAMFGIYRAAYREAGLDDWFFAPIRLYTRLIKSLAVTISRFVPIPQWMGYLAVLSGQFVFLWYALKWAFSGLGIKYNLGSVWSILGALLPSP